MENKGPVGNCFCLDQPSRSTTLPHLFYLIVILLGKPGKGFCTSLGDSWSCQKGWWEAPNEGGAAPAQQVISGMVLEGDEAGETDQNSWLPSPPVSASSVEWEWAGDPLCLTGNEKHTSVPLGLVFREWIGLRSSGGELLPLLSLAHCAHYSELCRH